MASWVRLQMLAALKVKNGNFDFVFEHHITSIVRGFWDEGVESFVSSEAVYRVGNNGTSGT